MKRTILLGALLACGSKQSPPPPTGTRIGPAIVAAMDAANRATAPWRCAAMDAPGLADATIAVGKRTWTLAGHALATTGDTLAIGFVADAGGAAPPTIAALGRLRAKLGDVDLVVALGGMGTTRAELEGTLGALTGEAPLVALPGDLEAAPALSQAVRALAANRVIDGRLVRRIELPKATIATLSGTLAASRLVAGSEGCGIRPDDVSAMFAAMSSRPGLRILASIEAPRTRVEGEPAGDRALVAAAAQQLDLVVYGAAGTRATPAKTGGRDGLGIAVSPGTSDATTRLPARQTPTAGILTIDDKTWRWRTVSDGDRP